MDAGEGRRRSPYDHGPNRGSVHRSGLSSLVLDSDHSSGLLGLLRSFWINRARQSNAAMSPEERNAAQTAMYAKVEEARRNLAAVTERLKADRKGINGSDGH